MPDGDGPAVDVDPRRIEAELAHAGEGLRRERLVELDEIEVAHRDPGAREIGVEPLGAFVGSAVAGVDPAVMGVGPIPAVRKLLDRTGVAVEDVDLVELNEAFASQSLAVVRELGIDEERVNVNGGAIAIGHPLGMSGARLVVTLLHELGRRGGRYGIATMCVGVGQGQAALFERGS